MTLQENVMTSPTIQHFRHTPGRRPGTRPLAPPPPPLPAQQATACAISVKCFEHGIHACTRTATVEVLMVCTQDQARQRVHACEQHNAGIGSWPARCPVCGSRMRTITLARLAGQ